METTFITTGTNRRLHKMLSLSGQKDNKKDLVMAYTDGRTEHSSNMMEFEALNLISKLSEAKPTPVVTTTNPNAESDDRMRKKILSRCHTLGWYLRDSEKQLILKGGKPQLNFIAINHFCFTKGPFKKRLNAHRHNELVTLVTVFDKLTKQAIEKL